MLPRRRLTNLPFEKFRSIERDYRNQCDFT